MQNTGTRKVLNNALWLFGDKLVHLLVGFLVGIWVARHLGPEQYGWLSYAIAFIGFFDALSRMGIINVVIKKLVEKPENSPQIMNTALALRFGAGFLVYALAVIAVLIFNPEPQIILWMTILLGSNLVFQAIDSLDYQFQALLLSRYSVVAKKLAYLISSALKIALILANVDLIYFALAIVIEAILAGIFFIYFYRKKIGKSLIPRIHKNITRPLLREGLPLMFTAMMAYIYTRIDQIMIGEMINGEELGKYAAAVRISDFWFSVPMLICASVFPSIVRSYAEKDKFNLRLKRLLSFLFWMPALAALLVSAVANPAMNFLYGEAYAGSGAVLSIQAWTALFIGFNSVSYRYFVLIEKTMLIFYRSLLGMALNIALNLYLIPTWGIAGAAIATLISQFAISYLFNLFAAPDFFIKQSKAMLPGSIPETIRYSKQLINEYIGKS